ncbi:hypothetical protein [Streptomyces smyrnaeus]|uniref:hypothetical protein n=1 Tax=Streptomyces smyrnaeus TaxID=1387713 RepID=UPI0033DC7188
MGRAAYHFTIVGGGSARRAPANRLSAGALTRPADESTEVALGEARLPPSTAAYHRNRAAEV